MLNRLSGLAVLSVMLLASSASAQQVDLKDLIAKVESGNENDRIAAIDALAEMGRDARAAVPALSKAVTLAGDAESRWRAARALAAIGPAAAAAVPSLIQALGDQDPMVRAYAAHALGKIGPAAREAVPELVKKAVDESRLVRREAREALLAIKAPSEVTLPLLLKVLEESEPEAVVSALETLAEQGKKIVPKLCEALHNEKACYWACLLIERIGPEAKEAVPHLIDCLDREEPEVRIEVLLALASIGKDSRVAQDKVIKILQNDPYEGVRYAAAFALGRLGDAKAIPALEAAANSDDEFLRLTALWSLVQLKPDDKELMQKAVETFANGLRSDDPRLRSAAATAFAETDIPPELAESPLLQSLADQVDEETKQKVVDALVKRGKAAVPRAIRALDNPKLQLYALQIIGKIGPDAAEAVPKLVELVNTADDAKLRREAVYALAGIGPQAAAATDVLVKLLKEGDNESKYAACYALGRIGPDAAAANSTLLELVDSPDRFLRVSALWALLKINPGDEQIAKYAIPHLIGALADPRPQVRAEMAGALGELGPLAKDAVPALERLAKTDPEPAVRDVASEALVKIQDPMAHRQE